MVRHIHPSYVAILLNYSRGLASTLQAAAFGWSGLMASRFFLAAAEAGFGPGVPYLLTFFYKRHELGLRCGLYLSAAPLASSFAGALAYGITSGHTALASWRLLFIVEGIPSVLLAFVAYWFIPDSADTARFLTDEEKEVARARAIQQTGDSGTARIGHVNFKDIFMAFRDIKTWIPPFMYFSCNGRLGTANRLTNDIVGLLMVANHSFVQQPARLPPVDFEEHGLHRHQRPGA